MRKPLQHSQKKKRFSEQTIKVCNYYYQQKCYWFPSFKYASHGRYDFIIRSKAYCAKLFTFYVLYRNLQIKNTKILGPTCLKYYLWNRETQIQLSVRICQPFLLFNMFHFIQSCHDSSTVFSANQAYHFRNGKTIILSAPQRPIAKNEKFPPSSGRSLGLPHRCFSMSTSSIHSFHKLLSLCY